MMMQGKVMGGGNKPILELLFDTDFTDTSGRGHTVTASGGGGANVVGGKCEFTTPSYKVFGGGSDIYDLGFSDGLSDLPFTIQADVNVSLFNTVDGFSTIINNMSGNTTGNRNFGIGFNSSKFYILLYDYASGGIIRKDFNYAIAINTVNALKFTYDASGTIGGVKFYVNNTEITSFSNNCTGTYTRMAQTSRGLTIGSYSFYVQNWFRGTIDNFKIYDKVI
jgi:hypothetical protein